jgi:hypothetical protein
MAEAEAATVGAGIGDNQAGKFLAVPEPFRIYEKVILSGSATSQSLFRKSRSYSERILNSQPRLRTCFGSWGRFGRFVFLFYFVVHIAVALSYNFKRAGWILYASLFFIGARFCWSAIPWLWQKVILLAPERFRALLVNSVHLIFLGIILVFAVVKAIKDNALISLLGLAVGFGLCYLFSFDRAGIAWRPVIYGIVLQVEAQA